MYEFMNHLRRERGQGVRLELHENGFFPVTPEEICRAEAAINFPLPFELRTFYQEIGEGRLQTGKNGNATDYNNVAGPGELIEIFTGASDWLMPYSQLQPGTLPFFQRDVDLFLCLHPGSNNPNSVYWMWGEKICDSLVEFFQRLVVDPDWFNPPAR